jgi:acetyl-CoA carboxylase biotin carboxylase subunit
VRWDGGIEKGSEVTLYYDPMLAKLIVWAPTRELAIERMHRALEELAIEGVETSRDFHLRVMEDEEFQRGAIEIQWLERRLASLLEATPSESQQRLAAIAAALLAARERSAPHRSTSATSGQRADEPLGEWKRAARIDGLQ